MKAHVGADGKTGLMHRAVIGSADVHYRHLLPVLLHGIERRIFGDRGGQVCRDIIKPAVLQAPHQPVSAQASR